MILDGRRGDDDRLVSLREAARLLGVHHATVSRAVKRGDLREAMVTPGGWKRFKVSDVMNLAKGARAKVISSRLERTVRNGSSEIESALAVLPEIARKVIGADYAAVTVLNADGRVTQMFYAGMSEQEASAVGEPPSGVGVLGQLGKGGGVLRLAKISDHPRAAGFPANHPRMEALLGIGVSNHDGLRANLYVANGAGHPEFTDADEARLLSVAEFARLAIENTGLYEREALLRRRAEELREQLDEVIRSSSAGVIVLDAATQRIVSASAEAKRLLHSQLESGDSVDTYAWRVHQTAPGSPDAPVHQLPGIMAITTGSRVGPIELTVVGDDGQHTPILVSASPVFDPSGRVASSVVVFQDISKMKELDQVKADFLSMVTHDLRTPLTTIKGIGSLVRSLASGDQELEQPLNELDEEVDHVTELVGNLLDMSRIESGASRSEYETSHMLDIVSDAVSRARRSRLGQGRQIASDVPSNLPPVYVDPLQIGRVLDNLLSNALKYSEGSIAVQAGFDDARQQVTVHVTDSGDGIPSKFQREIFDKFMRVRQGGRRGREGAGLGLAICKAIIEVHGGQIGVQSIEREGSDFWFRLPVESPAPIRA